VWEHELYSFKIERENLGLLSKANENYINEIMRQNQLEQVA
jgi:hypothetical protein